MYKSVAAQNASCNAVTRLVDQGSFNPTGQINLFNSDGSVLANLILSLPAFSDATDGTAYSNPIADSTVFIDGSASTFAVLNRDALAVWTGTVSDFTGIGDLKLNSVYLIADSTLTITSMIYVVPPEFIYAGPPGVTGIQGITGIQGVTGIQGQTGMQTLSGVFNFFGVPTGILGQTVLSHDTVFDSWTVLTDSSSSLVLDIQKSTYSNYPDTISMHGSTGIFLASSTKNTGTTAFWSGNTGSAGDILKVVLTESDGSANIVSLTLNYTV